METPKLIDTQVQQYIKYALQKCHEKRVELYSWALNIFVFLFICVFFGITLHYCYKKKPTEYEKRRKMIKDQEYILSKIRYYQQIKDHQKNTWLPDYQKQ